MALTALQHRRVFQTCRAIFKGPLANTRKQRAINRVIRGN